MNALRIARSSVRRPSGLPGRELTRSVAVDREHLAAYDRVCGFRLRDELPATYPHVLAFPLAMDLLTGPFPVSPLGLVHVANRIEQLRPLRADERLDLRVRAADLRPHDRGRQFDIVAEAAARGEIVWRDCSTYLRHVTSPGGRRLRRARTCRGWRLRRPDGETPNPGARGETDPPPPTAIWHVPGDIGRRYSRVSGDANPIHLHPLTARVLGQPGAIAHGMWTKARCLAALEGSLPDAYAVDVRFKLPLRIPGTAAFSYGDGRFEVRAGGKPHLEGRISSGRDR